MAHDEADEIHYVIAVCSEGHIHLAISFPEDDEPFDLALSGESAFALAHSLLRGCEALSGTIATPPGTTQH